MTSLASSNNNNIVVVGSCMMDFISYAPRLPQEGETIHGTQFVTTYGGKGANQCVAAAKLGGKTTLIARVGDDIWGDKYIDNLKCQGIDTQYIRQSANASTGIAQITVATASGHNQIVIVAGANGHLSPRDIVDGMATVKGAAVLVVQLETSVDVALKALTTCQGITILNGAPALTDYPPELLTLPTIFCVNETEAATFTGLKVTNIPEAKHAAKTLIAKGCKCVILTLGSQGAIYCQIDDIVYIPCPTVECCIDSTGAGDAFIGALAYLLANNNEQCISIVRAIEIACVAASDSVTRIGTQISFPSYDVIKKYLERVDLI